MNISIETRTDIGRAPSPGHPAVAYCQGPPLRMEIENHDASVLESIAHRAAEMIEAEYGSGDIEAKIQAFVFAAKTKS